MRIAVKNVGKKYNRHWLFRALSYDIAAGKSYAITGANGSGKSTLLQMLLGYSSPTEGHIQHYRSNQPLEPLEAVAHISFAAPYIELIEEYTALEYLSMYLHLKGQKYAPDEIQELLLQSGLKNIKEKRIKDFSSGMKQRVRLIASFGAGTELLLLDEPTSNLDTSGIDWYLQQMALQQDKTIIVSSNIREEYSFCEHIIALS